MGVYGLDFIASEGGLQEPLKVVGEGDCVLELLEPHEWGHVVWLEMSLLYVIEDHVSHLDMIVVCVFLLRVIVLIELRIVLVQPTKR